jgi:hypothetical protein
VSFFYTFKVTHFDSGASIMAWFCCTAWFENAFISPDSLKVYKDLLDMNDFNVSCKDFEGSSLLSSLHGV